MSDKDKEQASGHYYSTDYYKYINDGSSRSAMIIASIIKDYISIDSVLDVGCGQGAWLAGWKASGIKNIFGLDGNYVKQDELLIDRKEFQPCDLSLGFSLDKKFDLVQSLEVAEHLPRDVSEKFVDSLCSHGDFIMFSAAQPGQGGECHVNERPLDFWRELFAKNGYHAYDFLRPKIQSEKDIKPWYRYNTMLFVSEAKIDSLPSAISETKIPQNAKIPPTGSISWRLRRFILRPLPVSIVTLLAKLNTKLSNL